MRSRRWISFGLFAAFLGLYLTSIDLRAPNVLAHNFVFDADLDRILADVLGRQNDVVFGRHPLFELIVAWPASALAGFGLPTISAIRLIVASGAALSVAASTVVFRGILADERLAVAFAILFGTCSTVWLLASVPETFALNAAVITACFLMREQSSWPSRENTWRFATFVLLSALAIGVTVTNGVYVVLAYLVDLRRSQTTWRSRAGSLLAYAVAVAIVFVALLFTQRALLGSKVSHDLAALNPLAASRHDVFLSFARPFSFREMGHLTRAFLVDNLVAPGCVVQVVESATGPNQMLQFGNWKAPGYVIGLLALVALTVVAVLRRTAPRALRSRSAEVAFLYIGFNVVFHFFYRANGQPFIFTIHTALPVLVLVAELLAGSLFAFRWALVAVAVTAVAAQNALFIGRVRDALALGCKRKVGVVCVEWSGHPGERYTRGLAAYLGSTSYLGDAGTDAFEHARYGDAVRFYEQALARDPTLTSLEANLAVSLVETGHDAEAVEHFRRAQAARAAAR